jgi:broad specificity phosphatase PhoE
VHLTLLRHAESTWNAEGRWQGQLDPPLSPRGQLQARAVAERLFGRGFDHRYTSDLTRTRQTSDAVGEGAEQDASVREVDVGAWGGLLRDEVQARFGGELERLRAGEADVAIGGGESMTSFEVRVDAALARLRGRHQVGERVLVTTHGGVIRAFVARLLGVRRSRGALVGVENTSLTEVDWTDPERPRLLRFNDATHLSDIEHRAERAWIAAEATTDAPRATVDRLLSGLRVATYEAIGEAQRAPLASALGATPRPTGSLDTPPEEEPLALLAPPPDLREATVEAVALDPAGLAAPAPGTVIRLRRRSGGELILQGYALRFG